MLSVMTHASPFPFWQVYECVIRDDWPELPPALQRRFGTLSAWQARHQVRAGQRFPIGPDGRPDARVNAFFASETMGALSESTNRKYAYSVAVWLNFLLRHHSGRRWFEAEVEQIEDFAFWRMIDARNPRRVSGTTWRSDLAALSAFYGWEARTYGVRNPIMRLEREAHQVVGHSSLSRPRAAGAGTENSTETTTENATELSDIGERRITMLTQSAFRRWVDMGLHGIEPDGREARVWRGRNSERDAAFANLLYETGLRVSEAGSLLVEELPPLDRDRPYFTCLLASRCAAGARGRKYSMPFRVRDDLDQLIGLEGERNRAIERAQRAHRYDSLPHLRLLVQMRDRRLRLRAPGGHTTDDVALDDLGPRERRALFKETPSGLEPLALWVNEDGLPREVHGWQATFQTANRRIRRLGIADLDATPSMLRHSFAYHWYCIGRNIEECRSASLTEEDIRYFDAQIGDAWELVRRLLGHARVETTRQIYREPFQRFQALEPLLDGLV
jgi:integrase